MTRSQQVAKNLRTLVMLFWLLGFLATLGYMISITSAFNVGEDQFVDSGTVLALAVQLIAVWVGLAWMGLLAMGVAELLSHQGRESAV